MAAQEVKDKPIEIKRFGLNMPTNEYQDIQKYADNNHFTVTEAIRGLIKIGLYMQNNTVYVDDGAGSYREIVFIV